MEQSILISTKNVLGMAADYTVFDLAIITHINGALSIAEQAGVGLLTVFGIEDETTLWQDLNLDAKQLAMLKNYVYLKVKFLFDPPATSFTQEAMAKQIEEMEYRMNVNTELKAGTA